MEIDLPDGIVPVTREMAEDLAGRLRPEHCRELSFVTSMRSDAALRFAARTSQVCYAGVRDERPILLTGVGSVSALSDSGYGWMLGSDDIDRHGLWVADTSRKMLPLLHAAAGVRYLENWVPADYRRALKWFRWMGFSLGGERVINGMPHIHVVHEAGDSE